MDVAPYTFYRVGCHIHALASYLPPQVMVRTRRKWRMWAPQQLQGHPRHRPLDIAPSTSPPRHRPLDIAPLAALSLFALVELRWQGRITMVGQRPLKLAMIDAAQRKRR
jgi:hypothetical protein